MKIKLEIAGRTYEWAEEYIWSVLKSRERGVREGDTRVIGGVLCYAHDVYDYWPERSGVNWTPVYATREEARAKLFATAK